MAKGSPRYSSDDSSSASCSTEDEEYELLPHKRVLQLEKEVGALKKNPLGSTGDGKSLMEHMDTLSKSMNDLVKIFKTASSQMDLEERETELVSKQLGPLMEKIDLLIDQNKKIAKGIVAIADMVEDHKKDHEDQSSGEFRQTSSSLPKFSIPQRDMQPPLPPPPPSRVSLPVPPQQNFPSRPPSFPMNPFDDIPPISSGFGSASPPTTPQGGPFPSPNFPQPPPNMMPTSSLSPGSSGAPQKKKGFF
ncbi:hypothetical protein HYS47_02620 [Candidatus Woesearchaeota archaeon]|nr:hypothetical protein [Candidatus Woesearchaeota archaeon]